MENDLTAEQWKAIAEKLAKHIDEMCPCIEICDTYPACPFKCDETCEPMFALKFVKKELGYETVQKD